MAAGDPETDPEATDDPPEHTDLTGDGVTAGPGRVLIWPGRAVYVGPLLDHEAHAHHALQISVALEGKVSVQLPPEERWRHHQAVATAPDQSHRLRCGGLIAQIYLDPESRAGLAIRQTLLQGARARALPQLNPRVLTGLRSGPTGGLAPDQVADAIDELTDQSRADYSRDLIDPRVQLTLTTVHAMPGRRAPLPELAKSVGLSPSRLGALFRRDIGLPLRRYLLWLRLIDAIEALARGATLTRAAHDAGFADSAHLTRTFHHMFGMPPSALQTRHVTLRDYSAGHPAAPWWTDTKTASQLPLLHNA